MPEGSGDIVTTLIPVDKVGSVVERLMSRQMTDDKARFVISLMLVQCFLPSVFVWSLFRSCRVSVLPSASKKQHPEGLQVLSLGSSRGYSLWQKFSYPRWCEGTF